MQSPFSQQHSATVLLVDDEDAVRGALALALERLRLQVTEAVDTNDALRVMSRQRFDLIIMDWLMPGGGGRRLIEEVASWPDPPTIIVLTGAVFLEDDVDWDGWDAVADTIEKPFDVPDFLARVERALDGARSR